ncbi:MAG: hypothetical protein R3360_05750, partial [Alphaproteobacteria bacterium]|nr:hypothetical protein [Alphaproteobacteria bacterium]
EGTTPVLLTAEVTGDDLQAKLSYPLVAGEVPTLAADITAPCRLFDTVACESGPLSLKAEADEDAGALALSLNWPGLSMDDMAWTDFSMTGEGLWSGTNRWLELSGSMRGLSMLPEANPLRESLEFEITGALNQSLDRLSLEQLRLFSPDQSFLAEGDGMLSLADMSGEARLDITANETGGALNENAALAGTIRVAGEWNPAFEPQAASVEGRLNPVFTEASGLLPLSGRETRLDLSLTTDDPGYTLSGEIASEGLDASGELVLTQSWDLTSGRVETLLGTAVLGGFDPDLSASEGLRLSAGLDGSWDALEVAGDITAAQLAWRQIRLSDLSGDVVHTPADTGPRLSLELAGQWQKKPAKLSTVLRGGERWATETLSLSIADFALTGQLSQADGALPVRGDVTIEAGDQFLGALLPLRDVDGRIRAGVSLGPEDAQQEVRLNLSAPRTILLLGGERSAVETADASLRVNMAEPAKIRLLEIEAGGLSYADTHLKSLSLQALETDGLLAFSLQTEGRTENDLTLNLSGQTGATLEAQGREIEISQLSGQIRSQPLLLDGPTRATIKEDGFSLSPTTLQLGEGSIAVSADMRKATSKLDFQA